MCLPKGEGGLGFLNLTAWNKAILSKIIWNIYAKIDSLWIRWIHSEILNSREFWNTQTEARDPCLFRSLYRIRNEILGACSGDPTKGKEMMEGWFKGKGVAEAYDFFRHKRVPQFLHKTIWRSYIPPRFSVTMWFALQGRLKTVDRVKFVDQSQLCLLCGTHDESHDHLFFSCSKTKELWSLVKNWLRITGTVSTISNAILFCSRNKAGSGVLRKARWLAMAAMVNHIWYVRNKLKHQKTPFRVRAIFRDVKIDVIHVLYNLFPPEVVMSHMDINTRD